MAYCLIVDDDPSVAELLATVLAHVGHRVAVARTGADALRLSASGAPDLVLVDRNLPDGRGADLVRTLRHRIPGLPALMISGAVGAEELAEAHAAGARELLGKPFDSLDLVLEAVGRALTSG